MRLPRLSLAQRVKRDKITDMKELRELMEHEMRNWGPRMRYISSMGEPTAGLGFTGVVVPNNEVVVSPASVSSQAEISLYSFASVGANTWMYIPPGNFRAPQSWRVWAGGTFSTGATTATLIWTTRLGTSNASAPNASASIGATGAMAPGSVSAGGVAGASVTAAPWWYEAHFTVRSPGTSGTAIGWFDVELACQSPPANTMTGMGGTGATITLDTTQGAYYSIGITSSASATTGAQLQALTIVAWD
jgi:hypothetical protein